MQYAGQRRAFVHTMSDVCDILLEESKWSTHTYTLVVPPPTLAFTPLQNPLKPSSGRTSRGMLLLRDTRSLSLAPPLLLFKNPLLAFPIASFNPVCYVAPTHEDPPFVGDDVSQTKNNILIIFNMMSIGALQSHIPYRCRRLHLF